MRLKFPGNRKGNGTSQRCWRANEGHEKLKNLRFNFAQQLEGQTLNVPEYTTGVVVMLSILQRTLHCILVQRPVTCLRCCQHYLLDQGGLST